jgi:spore germination cell wall hydrolase CwlJ-like protein
VPEAQRLQSAGSLAPLPLELATVTPAAPIPADSSAFALPVNHSPAAKSIVFRADTGLDQSRALDCLAEAVYYEARSESEDGQRAVAQVVLNRVRHPAYPGSVCGVVYQGPMRAGGGCQFTFTCDGSLARRPFGPGWSRARRIAAEALAGNVFAPVGHATHYHTFAVAPDWAPKLTKAAVIGAHIFYRWPGSAGTPEAFRQPYAGREPSSVTLASYTAPASPQPVPFQPSLTVEPAIAAAAERIPALELASSNLPQSRVRPEYQNSGRWKKDPR